MKHRILACIMAVVLHVGLMPTAALAARPKLTVATFGEAVADLITSVPRS